MARAIREVTARRARTTKINERLPLMVVAATRTPDAAALSKGIYAWLREGLRPAPTRPPPP